MVAELYNKQNPLYFLLSLIERKMAEIGHLVWENVSQGFSNKAEQYEDLISYKEIVLQRLHGCECLVNDKILISKIKQLTA